MQQGLQGDQPVEHGDAVQAQERLRGDEPGEHPQAQRRGQGHAASVPGVGQDPAPQPAEDQREHGDQAHSAHGEGGAGDAEDLQGHGHRGDLEAQHGEGGAQPQPPEIRVLAQGREVHHEAGHTGKPSRGLNPGPAGTVRPGAGGMLEGYDVNGSKGRESP
ncbi:Uncharacterised protein [Mycobacteroides abscessus subsp. abscessus]|nr:Uncharacterised protein [Mycobacteroides abscessus subsp. abscessus]